MKKATKEELVDAANSVISANDRLMRAVAMGVAETDDRAKMVRGIEDAGAISAALTAMNVTALKIKFLAEQEKVDDGK